MTRKHAKIRSISLAQKPTGAAPVPAPAKARKAAQPEHPHQNLDRGARAALARLSGGVSSHAFMEAWTDWAFHFGHSPGRQLELAERAQQSALKLMTLATRANPSAPPPFSPKPYDHRFRHPGWQTPPFLLWQQGFLAMQDWWDHATDHLRGLRPEDADRTRFMARQSLDMVSPSNFPTLNPEIIAATLASGGRNLTDGAAHFVQDMVKTLTQTHDPAPEGYQVGQDLACTPGEVVFRNDLFELIQYAPQTAKVQAEPILIVPAWIMKYYILDLSPAQFDGQLSWCGQGFTVFMISWCNPTAEQADLSLEDYRTSRGHGGTGRGRSDRARPQGPRRGLLPWRHDAGHRRGHHGARRRRPARLDHADGRAGRFRRGGRVAAVRRRKPGRLPRGHDVGSGLSRPAADGARPSPRSGPRI